MGGRSISPSFVFLILLLGLLFVILTVTAQPTRPGGTPLSVRSSGREGTKALLILARRLGFQSAIHMRPLALVPRGSKVIVPGVSPPIPVEMDQSGGAVNLKRLERALERGVDVIYIAPLTMAGKNNATRTSKTQDEPVTAGKQMGDMEEKDGGTKEAQDSEEAMNYVHGEENRRITTRAQSRKGSPAARSGQTSPAEAVSVRTSEKPAGGPDTRIIELPWDIDEDGGIHVYPPGNFRVFADVREIHTKTLRLEDAYVLEFWNEELGGMEEAYVLKGTSIPVLAFKKSLSSSFVALLVPQVLTNAEIGLADNVILAYNLLTFNRVTPIFFVETLGGVAIPSVGVTSLLLFTKGGKFILAVLAVLIIALLPYMFPLGKHYASEQAKFPSQMERMRAFSSMIGQGRLFKQAVIAGFSEAYQTSQEGRELNKETLKSMLIRLGVSEKDASLASLLLFTEGKTSRRQKAFLIRLYSELKLKTSRISSV